MDTRDTLSTLMFDRSLNGNHGVLTSTPLTKQNGKINQSVNFASGGYIEAPDVASLEPAVATLSAWVKTSAVRAEYAIHKLQGSGAFPGYALGINTLGAGNTTDNGAIACWSGDLGGWTTASLGSGVISDGKWHHFVCSISATITTVYFDGVQKGQAAKTASIPSTATLQIGRQVFTLTTINGNEDDVRVYNRVLSGEEIKQLYRQGLATYGR